jgi:hypothetical protein
VGSKKCFALRRLRSFEEGTLIGKPRNLPKNSLLLHSLKEIFDKSAFGEEAFLEKRLRLFLIIVL